jgi:hypothetical protein
VVFILGAGASAHTGAPLMKDFLQKAEELLENGNAEEVRSDFETIIQARGELNAVHSKANINTENIESVYTAFEMGKLLGKLPGTIKDKNADSLIRSLKKVIGYTLENTVTLEKEKLTATTAYHKFAVIIKDLVKKPGKCSILSFNYDLALDYYLNYENLNIDYGLNDMKFSSGAVIPYLKLHGSLNFGQCSSINCASIIANRNFRHTTYNTQTQQTTIERIAQLKTSQCKKCDASLLEDPVLIPPTWNKTALHAQIGQVWQRAAKELSNAKYIFVLGYSLPETDWFFNYLYGLGVDMNTQIAQFHVYNRNQEVDTRFQKLLGIGVMDHYRFHKTTFEDFVNEPNPLWKSNSLSEPFSFKYKE